MARKTTPTFIVELPLSVARADAREMGVRLELGRQLYNACLGEGLRRLERMREGLGWAQASAMPRMKGRKPNKERAAAFAAARAAAGFTSAAISAFGTRCKNEAKWNDGRARTDARVGAHECQLIAQQAFSALEMYAFGKRGRPRFKGKGRPLHSLQGKSADSGIYWNPGTACLEWGALRLRAKLPPLRKDPWLERALARRTKFARIVWRQVKGRRRWFVQLAQEGFSPQKYHTVKDATVGLDVGPSTLAVVSDRAAALCLWRRKSNSPGRRPGACNARWIARGARQIRTATMQTVPSSAVLRSSSAPGAISNSKLSWLRPSVCWRSVAPAVTGDCRIAFWAWAIGSRPKS